MRPETTTEVTEPAWVPGPTAERPSPGAPLADISRVLASIAWAVLQSGALIAIVVLLVFVVLPAVLGGAAAAQIEH